eukprot:scaffold26.g3359.t1
MEVESMDDFQSVLRLSHQVPVVLDAYAQWCGPCKQLDATLRAAVAGAGGAVALAKLDIDKPALAQLVTQMQITSEISGWIAEIAELAREQRGGAPGGAQAAGRPPPAELLAAGFEALDAPADAPQPSSQQARPLAGGRRRGVAHPPLAHPCLRAPRTQVAPLFGQVLQKDSGASEAQRAAAWAGMALCALLEGNAAGARDMLSSATAAAPKGEAPLDEGLEGLYERALRLFAARRQAEAVEAALRIVRENREWNEQAGKRLALRLFDALGRGSEVARSGRRRLANYLFI